MLRIIDSYISRHGYSPSVRDVAEKIDRSVARTHSLLIVMRDLGLVTWADGTPRSLRLTNAGREASARRPSRNGGT